jgi:hypothetical protein
MALRYRKWIAVFEEQHQDKDFVAKWMFNRLPAEPDACKLQHRLGDEEPGGSWRKK